MKPNRIPEALILGALLCLGLALLGHFARDGFLSARDMDRTVTVKGLSEREVPANIAIWPIKFNEASDDLNRLYDQIQVKNDLVIAFLTEAGFTDEDITSSVPSVTDRQAQSYGGNQPNLRYVGSSTITVYTSNIEAVRAAMTRIVELGKQGLAISGQDYEARTEFLFTGLNSIKPEMIEEATRNAREVAEKFAADSGSRLGKIRNARQGQFSIQDRDSSTPTIKKVRVVATLEYTLVD